MKRILIFVVPLFVSISLIVAVAFLLSRNGSDNAEAVKPVAVKQVEVINAEKPVAEMPKIKQKGKFPDVLVYEDLDGLELSDGEKKDVLDIFSTFKEALVSKDKRKAMENADKLRYWGLDIMADSAYVKLAGILAGVEDIEAMGDELHSSKNPAAGIVYGCALMGSIQNDDAGRVRELLGKLGSYPRADEYRNGGMKFLVEKAKSGKNIDAVIGLSREMFLSGDFSGARFGFESSMSVAGNRDDKLRVVREFLGFGYSVLPEKEMLELADYAVSINDYVFLSQLLDKVNGGDRAKLEDHYFEHISSLGEQDKPLKAAIGASIPLMAVKDKRIQKRLLGLWSTIGNKRLQARDIEGVEKASDFMLRIPADNSKELSMNLLGETLKLKDGIDAARKFEIMRRISNFGDIADGVISEQAPNVFSDVVAASNVTDIQKYSQFLVDSKIAGLKDLGLKGYEQIARIAKRLMADGDYPQVISIADTLISNGPQTKDAGMIILTEICKMYVKEKNLDDGTLEMLKASVKSSGNGNLLRMLRSAETLRKKKSAAADLEEYGMVIKER
ncbi:hypothetical protein ACFLQ8_01185 [Candidatus Auribacterota bacterium]